MTALDTLLRIGAATTQSLAAYIGTVGAILLVALVGVVAFVLVADSLSTATVSLGVIPFSILLLITGPRDTAILLVSTCIYHYMTTRTLQLRKQMRMQIRDWIEFKAFMAEKAAEKKEAQAPSTEEEEESSEEESDNPAPSHGMSLRPRKRAHGAV